MNMKAPIAVRRSHAERTREATGKLIHAAMEIISEEGMKGLTLLAVGNRAGLSRELARYHFGSKAGLVRELLDESFRQRRAYYDERIGKGLSGMDVVFESLARLPEEFRTKPVEYRAHMLLLMEGALDPDPDVRQKIQNYNISVRTQHTEYFFEALRSMGRGDRQTAAVLAATYMGAVRGINFQCVLEGENFDFEGAVKMLGDMLGHAISNGIWSSKKD